MTNEETVYSCLEPRGKMSDIPLSSPSRRVDDLNDKNIYFVDNGKNGADLILKTIMTYLEKDYPDANLVFYPKTTAYSKPEPQSWWKVLEENADTAVVAVGD